MPFSYSLNLSPFSFPFTIPLQPPRPLPHNPLHKTPTNIPVSAVTFADGNVFTWNINANAQSQPDYTQVGTSHNNYRSFNVYKDSKRVLYSQDGWDFRTIYYCT
jgi:hypothetical protein